MSAGRTLNTKSQSWNTPLKYITPITNFFGGYISLDPCSNDCSLTNATIEYKLPSNDGLTESWNYPTIFVNPPYGRDKIRGTSIKNWLIKCVNAHYFYGSEVIALIPVATNTSHWKETIFGQAGAVCFLSDTRLKFFENGVEHAKGAPMACALIYWGFRIQDFKKYFGEFGAILEIT